MPWVQIPHPLDFVYVHEPSFKESERIKSALSVKKIPSSSVSCHQGSMDRLFSLSFRTMRRLSVLKQPLLSTVNEHLIDYPTPSNLTYWWGFGSLAGIALMVQILSGIFLAMHYTPHVDLAFASVEHIMRDVEGGWFLRYLHANGASFFFIVCVIWRHTCPPTRAAHTTCRTGAESLPGSLSSLQVFWYGPPLAGLNF